MWTWWRKWRKTCLFAGSLGAIVLVIVHVAYKQHGAAKQYKAERKQRCIAVAVTTEQKANCPEERDSLSDYLPWWYSLATWPGGIETWAIIGTGFFIAWQAWETRNAAVATQRQNETIFSKDRARMEVTTGTFTVDVLTPTVWHVESTVKVRNIGVSRAFISGTQAEMYLVKAGQKQEIGEMRMGLLPNVFIDATPEPMPVIIHFFPTEEISLEQISWKFFGQDVSFVILGFIDYETLGRYWRRSFGFVNKAGSPSLRKMLGIPEPTDALGRLTNGYWSVDNTYPNEEYEITEAKPQNRN